MLCLIHSLCSFSGDTEVITPQHLLSVAGQPAKVLIDSGATDKYVDAAFAAANGLQVTNCEGHVLVSGKKQIAIHGYVHTHLHIHSFSEEIKLFIIDLPGNSMQAVLGQSWLKAHKAVISYVNNCVPYFSGSRRRRLCFCPNAPDLPSLPANPSLLTHLQLKTMCRDKQNNTALPQAAKHLLLRTLMCLQTRLLVCSQKGRCVTLYILKLIHLCASSSTGCRQKKVLLE